MTLQRVIPQIVVDAIFEAEEALDTLRRGYGADVSALCYPAKNTVVEAASLLRRTGYSYQQPVFDAEPARKALP